MKLRIWLMATSAVLATSAADAAITANSLYISGSQPVSLSISQDSNSSTGGNNKIGVSATPFDLSGTIETIAITQTGTGNTLDGSVDVNGSGTTDSLTQTYGVSGSGLGFNDADIAITAGTLSGSIVFNSTAASALEANKFNQTVTAGTSLAYAIAVTGKSNILTDELSASDAIDNNQTISTDGNNVNNLITGATSIDLDTSITAGNSHTITTESLGGGAKTVNNTIAAATGSSTVTTQFNAVAGAQSSTVTITNGQVNFGLDSNSASTSSTVLLTGVSGASGAANVRVVQGANAAGASANLTINGTGFTAGMISGTTNAVSVTQNTPAAFLNASFTAVADNYILSVTQ